MTVLNTSPDRWLREPKGNPGNPRRSTRIVPTRDLIAEAPLEVIVTAIWHVLTPYQQARAEELVRYRQERS
jgi:hypothetical protein